MSLIEKVLMHLGDHERHEERKRFEPTQEQELLLRAALREGEEAVDAWREWHATVDIAHLDDVASQRLLPLVYRNLQAQTATVPGLEKIKGTYRYTWYKNQLLLQATATCLRAFHEAGIETMVLKGMALISCYYKDIGSRVMVDFDVLVREEQASAAIGVLHKVGWQPFDAYNQRPLDVASPERFFSFKHSVTFANATQIQCDLHVRPLFECIQVGGEEDFWDAAVPATAGGVPTRVLSPADQLFQVCVHGINQDTVPVHWIADAVTIVTTASASRDGINWHRLITQASKHRLILPVRDALCYLRDGWDVEVPAAVLYRLWERPVTRVERMEHAARIHPPTVLNRARYYWAQNTRLVGNAGTVQQLAHFPAYLRRVYKLKHSWQIPFRMAYALVRRIGLMGGEN